MNVSLRGMETLTYLCYETKFFVDCSCNGHEQSFFRILFFINESPLWCIQNGPRPPEAEKTWDGLGLGEARKVSEKVGPWGGASRLRRVRGCIRQMEHGGGHVSKWGATRRGAEPKVEKEDRGLQRHDTECRPHILSGADTPSGGHSYPIHGDVGPVVDAPAGWRERGWLAAVFRKYCSVQHKPKILVRKGWKTNPSLLQFVLGELGHPWSECKWCF